MTLGNIFKLQDDSSKSNIFKLLDGENPGSVDGLYNVSRWKGTSALNRTNVLTFNYVYDLPFFKSSSNAFVKGAFGGWEGSGITSFFSREPIDVQLRRDGVQYRSRH